MTVFADTSALYALLDADNVAHQQAADAWVEIRQTGQEIITTNYVLVETAALLQRRLGLDATRAFIEGMAQLLTVQWIDPEVHSRAVATLLAANRRDLSLVDCVSFEVMRRLGIRHAFTLDEHFREQGFDCAP